MKKRPLILFLTLLPITGCSNSPDRQEIEPYTETMWHEDLKLNEERLKTEDQREKEKPFQVIRAFERGIGNTFERIYDYITGNLPIKSAKDLLDPYFPDHRRSAIVYLADRDFGRRPPYLDYYLNLAKTDDDYLVRAMAVRALNRGRDRKAIPVFIQALEDQNDLVRLEAAKALANMPDNSAAPGLLKHLAGQMTVIVGDRMETQEESIDVRIACADALRSFRTIEVGQALVRALQDRNFSVAWQARKSLNFMTGVDYRFDTTAWLDYFGRPKPFG